MKKFLTVFFPFPRDYDLNKYSKVKIEIDDDDMDNATAYLLREGEGPNDASLEMTLPMEKHYKCTEGDNVENYIFSTSDRLLLYKEYQIWCVQMSEDIMYTLQEWAALPDETITVYKKFLHEGEAKGLEDFPYIPALSLQ